MSSVLRFLKQTPVATPYFISLAASPTLNLFFADAAASTTSYVSGAAPGYFSTSTTQTSAFGGAGYESTVTIFRDMGATIVSSGRTFRRVQLLTLDGGQALSNVNGQAAWTSQGQLFANNVQGVWQPSNEGVTGSAGPNSGVPDSAFSVFYFETGARGLGLAQGLIRYG
jgi:hypothetical protein